MFLRLIRLVVLKIYMEEVITFDKVIDKVLKKKRLVCILQIFMWNKNSFVKYTVTFIPNLLIYIFNAFVYFVYLIVYI